MEKDKIKPGKWLYFLAGAIILFGLVLVVISTISIFKTTNNFKRMLVPGNETFYFETEGDYVIYNEYKTDFNGFYFGSKDVEGINCRIVKENSRQEVKIKPSNSSETYQFGAKQGIAIFNFRIDEPGEYTVSANLRNNSQTVISIGKGNIVWRIVLTSLSVFALVFCFLAAGAIIIITFVSRRKNKNQNF